jgi:L-threonylcarbamoyladenylate synthase
MQITDIKQAANLLSKGKIIVYPTETLYGIGGNPFACGVCERIQQIKQEKKRAFILLIRDVQMLSHVVENITPEIEKLAHAFWPGPLTMILKTAGDLPCAEKDETAAFRIDAHPVVKSLFDFIDFPLISTSANIHGHESPKRFSEVSREILSQADGFIEDDRGILGLPSTIVKFDSLRPVIVRHGAIPEERIKEIL